LRALDNVVLSDGISIASNLENAVVALEQLGGVFLPGKSRYENPMLRVPSILIQFLSSEVFRTIATGSLGLGEFVFAKDICSILGTSVSLPSKAYEGTIPPRNRFSESIDAKMTFTMPRILRARDNFMY
jgi:hypothetical protein